MSLFGTDTTSSAFKDVKLGIIGGSGMCSFPDLKIISRINYETRYGFPSDDVLVCEYNDKIVAFLPRHGSKHKIAPHKIPYKANIAILKDLGVEYIIGTCIVGSLKKEIAPGSIVLPDQFVNLTWGRDDYTKEDSGIFMHLPMADPYCKNLGESITEVANKIKMPIITSGTVAVIQGPRFSTIAESRMFINNGWDLVNMTQYPECYFAKEFGICYSSVALVTDYDVGLNECLSFNLEGVNDVVDIFKNNIHKTKALILSFIDNFSPNMLSCKCASIIVKTYYEDFL